MSQRNVEQLCFADIDGTLVHYPNPAQFSELEGNILLLPQSSTGKQGVISQATLQKVADLRNAGVAFVIETGARTATLLQRLPYLPASDALVSENGGRIWYPDPDGTAACPLKEDDAWRARHADVVGAATQDYLPVTQRKGVLWDWYRQVQQEGWNIDANSYTTAFRVTKTPGKTPEDLERVIKRRPPQLNCSFNLGIADFYPNTSGKENAAQHLMDRFGVDAPCTAFLCDDDNDLPLAAMVGKAFLPSVSSASVELAVKQHPERFVVANVKWTGGTEQMLDALAAHFGLQHSMTAASV